MIRTLQILAICVVLVGVARGQGVAEDTWTSSLGRYTRILAETRRAQAEYDRLHLDGISTATVGDYDPYTWGRYRQFQRDYYVESGRESDVRYLQNRIASLTSRSFPTAAHLSSYVSTPSLFVQHQRMELSLLGREVYRQNYIIRRRPIRYSGYWVNGYTGIPHYRIY